MNTQEVIQYSDDIQTLAKVAYAAFRSGYYAHVEHNKGDGRTLVLWDGLTMEQQAIWRDVAEVVAKANYNFKTHELEQKST